jgi:hypothetical protein
MDPRAFFGLAGAPLIIALVQLAKLTFPGTPQHCWPAVTLAVAVVGNLCLAALLGSDLGIGALVGVVTGLSASGLYSYATVGK